MNSGISEKESAALKEFRVKIKDLDGEMDDEQRKDHILVRWLRARDLNVSKAEEMFRKHMAWRKENDLENIMSYRVPMEMKKALPFQVSGKDNDGCYVFVCPSGKWDIRQLCETGYTQDLIKGNHQFLEIVSDFIRAANEEVGKPTQFVNIMDMEGYSMRQMLSSQAREANMRIMKVLEANYPEILRKAVVVNAPKVFTLLFNLIKPILSAHTLSKVEIYDSNQDRWRNALRESIPADELPSQYGGSNLTCPIYHIDNGVSCGPRAPTFDPSLLQTVNVAAGSCHNIEIDVKSSGTVISWNFTTDDYDIGFKFLHGETVLYSCDRCDSHIVTQKGIHSCELTGKYTLQFSNEYSKLRSKTVHFHTYVEE